MNAEQLKAAQAPLKALYREHPSRAHHTLAVHGQLAVDRPALMLEFGQARIVAGLHAAAGGNGEDACSGDMILAALISCAGVTLKAVATAMEIEIRAGTVHAEGDLDFRGTLGLDKQIPVGFLAIRLRFELDSRASDEQLANLLRLSERYCVVFQSLRQTPQLSIVRMHA